MDQNRFILLLQRLLDLPYIFHYGPVFFFFFQCSISALDPETSYIDCISGVRTRDPIKIYRENQTVVLNIIFTQNHHFLFRSKENNKLYISLLLGQNRFILLLQRLSDLPYIFQYGPGVFNVASQPWTRDPITSIASLKSGPGTQLKYIWKTKM